MIPTINAVFDRLHAEVMKGADQFGHREHVHVTWLAVRAAGTERAIKIISEGIKRTARYAGRPQKFHATVSRAWVELVAHQLKMHPGDDFEHFIGRSPELLDKRLLTRYYHSHTLASPAARTGWVEPDKAPFPWAAAGAMITKR